ncbi:MAG TPA: energy transducer TonB, partial [Burkholderiales bacterium]|nr:energy transducer TonB [Burkholderiales bacterium]
PPKPEPVAAPEPPKPEPVIDKPDIAIKEPPKPKPKPVPVVKPKPEPPKPEPVVAPESPKPEPVIEKPDIAIQEPPKPKPKPVPVVKPKPEPPKPKPIAKPEPPRPAVREAEAKKRMQEELAREQASLALERERQQIRDQLARDASTARDRAIAGWVDKVRAKIRGNIVMPPDMKGNPEAIFDVVQLPTGEVLDAKLRKSSGHGAYDRAVENAIRKSSPLPRPDRPDLFVRNLELRFRPHD